MYVMPPSDDPETKHEELADVSDAAAQETPPASGERVSESAGISVPPDEAFDDLVQERARRLLGTRDGVPAGAFQEEHAFFVDSWRDLPPEVAREIAEEPLTLILALQLEGLGLESILSDRYASAALGTHLRDGHAGIRDLMLKYLRETRPKKRPGRAPNKIQRLLELDALGWNNEQIRLDIYGPNGTISNVTALRFRAKKSLNDAILRGAQQSR